VSWSGIVLGKNSWTIVALTLFTSFFSVFHNPKLPVVHFQKNYSYSLSNFEVVYNNRREVEANGQWVGSFRWNKEKVGKQGF
jgi:hypothetical protein